MATFNTSKYSAGSFYDNIKTGIKSGKYTSKKEPPKYIFESNKRGRKVKKLNPRWTAWNKRQQNKTNKTESKTTQTKNTPTFKQSIKAGEELNKTIKASDKKPKYKQVDAEELKKIQSDIKNKESKKETLKISPYRRTKGEGIEKKGGGYRGDTRTTARLKKAGFTETRLAGLRKKNAEFQSIKKIKDRKERKKKMEAYRSKYGK